MNEMIRALENLSFWKCLFKIFTLHKICKLTFRLCFKDHKSDWKNLLRAPSFKIQYCNTGCYMTDMTQYDMP